MYLHIVPGDLESGDAPKLYTFLLIVYVKTILTQILISQGYMGPDNYVVSISLGLP